jgi:hypothetical protein
LGFWPDFELFNLFEGGGQIEEGKKFGMQPAVERSVWD